MQVAFQIIIIVLQAKQGQKMSTSHLIVKYIRNRFSLLHYMIMCYLGLKARFFNLTLNANMK